ncbi:MAG: efflux RND transporter permease subunit, partial [Bacillota bacterium]
MKQLIKLATQNKAVTFIILGLFCAYGVFSLGRLPIDAVPDITQVQVMINAKTGPLSPEQIERQVTFPVESEVTGLPGVEEVRSLSKYGLSQVIVVFADGTDVYWARQQITERLNAMTFPRSITPELAPITTGLGEVVMYTLETTENSPLRKMSEFERLMRLRSIQEYVVRPELRRIQGVVDVDTNGGFRREVHVNIFPDKMKKHGVSILALKSLLMTLGDSEGGGYIEDSGQQIIVGLNNEISKLSDVLNMPLKTGFDGRPVRIKDVADVRIESGLRVGAATADGQEAVLGTVLMRSGANSREVASEALSRIKGLTLPDGVEIKVRYSRTFLVDATIKTVQKNLLEGAILVILILFFMLGDIRGALIVAMTIPVAMLGAFVGMNWLGISANLMSLGAIDFGLIVDGSVVLVENFIRRAGSPQIRESKFKFFLESTEEVLKPIFFGVLIIMLVYVPILFLGGIEGKMFRPMAITVLLALAVSLIFTIVIVPSLSSVFLKVDHPHHTPVFLQKLEVFYSRALNWSFAHKKVVLIPALCSLLAALYVGLFQLGSDFIPQLDEKDLVIGLVRPSSQSLTESVRWQKKSEEII